MIEYIVKSRLAYQSEDGKIEIKEVVSPFKNSENPVLARQNAYNHYINLLEVIGNNKDDLENNLSEHIWKFSEKSLLHNGNLKLRIPTNKEEFGVNLYFVLDEDFKKLKKGKEYLIIGEQEERNYLTTAENLVTEMEYFIDKDFNTEKWITTIKYWNYESDRENEEVIKKVLFTPFDFWKNWNPQLAEGNME